MSWIIMHRADIILNVWRQRSTFLSIYQPGPLQLHSIDDWSVRTGHLTHQTNITTAEECVVLCGQTPECASVDYKARRNECFMNSVGRFWSQLVRYDPEISTHIEIFPSLLGKPCIAMMYVSVNQYVNHCHLQQNKHFICSHFKFYFCPISMIYFKMSSGADLRNNHSVFKFQRERSRAFTFLSKTD